MNLKKILKDIMGYDSDGCPKTAISVTLYHYKSEDTEPAEVERADILKPEVRLQGTLDKVIVDLTFPDDHDVDLYRIFKVFDDYWKMLHKATLSKEEDVPLLYFMMLPIKENGREYAMATNPVMQCLTALRPGGVVNTIRIVFAAENIGFFTAEDIDISDVDAQLAMEEWRRKEAALRQQKVREEKNMRESSNRADGLE